MLKCVSNDLIDMRCRSLARAFSTPPTLTYDPGPNTHGTVFPHVITLWTVNKHLCVVHNIKLQRLATLLSLLFYLWKNGPNIAFSDTKDAERSREKNKNIKTRRIDSPNRTQKPNPNQTLTTALTRLECQNR
eukprot:sb/3474930/